LLAALDPEQLVREVVGPIQMAVEDFPRPDREPTSHPDFLETAGAFIRHLYWRAKHAPVKLSDREAKAEAVHLLEEHYQGVIGFGYVGALLDATRPEGPGLDAVLAELGEIIATKELLKLTTSTLVRLVNPTDWATKRRLVGEFLELLGPTLPRPLTEQPPDSLVSAYVDLLATYLEVERFVLASSQARATSRGVFPALRPTETRVLFHPP